MTVPLDVGFAKLPVDATKGEGTERRAGGDLGSRRRS